jgi:hypothetical protein
MLLQPPASQPACCQRTCFDEQRHVGVPTCCSLLLLVQLLQHCLCLLWLGHKLLLVILVILILLLLLLATCMAPCCSSVPAPELEARGIPAPAPGAPSLLLSLLMLSLLMLSLLMQVLLVLPLLLLSLLLLLLQQPQLLCVLLSSQVHQQAWVQRG